ncbi:esterase [Dactylosporangium vinaceum]|uniref:Alpha/beta hydrolase n=1 Tax=Dactylosporangium vinaceum TaxID=53362 RepID=A0ABV5ML33_9ACTN|nr:alpha/beta hydrolase-fold protein [Dactylosporangium vinaceum]UAB94023.1 esterase [Dactylosporangium vinaceum]
MKRPLDWPLLHGPVPFAVSAAAIAALGLLLYGAARRRAGWALVACGVAATLALTGGYVVDRVWRPFPDALPTMVLVWAGLGLAGVALAALWWPGRGWVRRLLAVAAALVALAGCASEINAMFGQYDSLRAALGMRPSDMISVVDATVAAPAVVAPAPGRGLVAVWRRPSQLGLHGRLMNTPIPGARSGFAARPAWIYLPPAYLSVPRAQLPVLILISGQPGTPRDWLDGGHIEAVMNEFARLHDGLAPIVVMPDGLGSVMANPLCMDSKLGNVETYLADDVPDWVRTHLGVDPDPRHWVVGGYSYGGTCALQLGVRRPDRYPTFLDISGQAEPTLGDRKGTVAAAFGGDAAAFARVNPRDIMAARQFPDTLGLIVAGREDAEYGPQQKIIRTACEGAGMQVRWWELPGGHSWAVWGQGLVVALPTLAARLGLTEEAPR